MKHTQAIRGLVTLAVIVSAWQGRPELGILALGIGVVLGIIVEVTKEYRKLQTEGSN